MNELSTLFNVFSKYENKELQITQLSVLLTLHKQALSDPKLKIWSNPACAKQVKISKQNNPGQTRKNS